MFSAWGPGRSLLGVSRELPLDDVAVEVEEVHRVQPALLVAVEHRVQRAPW